MSLELKWATKEEDWQTAALSLPIATNSGVFRYGVVSVPASSDENVRNKKIAVLPGLEIAIIEGQRTGGYLRKTL